MSIFTSSIWSFVFGYHRHFPNKTLLNKMINVEETCTIPVLFEELYRTQALVCASNIKLNLWTPQTELSMGDVKFILYLKLGNVVNYYAVASLAVVFTWEGKMKSFIICWYSNRTIRKLKQYANQPFKFLSVLDFLTPFP